jgi:hypothetical protein
MAHFSAINSPCMSTKPGTTTDIQFSNLIMFISSSIQIFYRLLIEVRCKEKFSVSFGRANHHEIYLLAI